MCVSRTSKSGAPNPVSSIQAPKRRRPENTRNIPTTTHVDMCCVFSRRRRPAFGASEQIINGPCGSRAFIHKTRRPLSFAACFVGACRPTLTLLGSFEPSLCPSVCFQLARCVCRTLNWHRKHHAVESNLGLARQANKRPGPSTTRTLGRSGARRWKSKLYSERRRRRHRRLRLRARPASAAKRQSYWCAH